MYQRISERLAEVEIDSASMIEDLAGQESFDADVEIAVGIINNRLRSRVEEELQNVEIDVESIAAEVANAMPLQSEFELTGAIERLRERTRGHIERMRWRRAGNAGGRRCAR
jgi:hypothetical protein